MYRIERSSVVGRPAAAVWERVASAEGINDELRPILRMTVPRDLRGRTVDDVEVGVPLGRSLVLLGGLIPVDYDDLCLAEVEPGRRFLERSRTISFSAWEHERVIEPAGDRSCRLTDRLGFELKRPLAALPGASRLATAIVRGLFAHRHRRLHRWASSGPGPRLSR